MFTTDEMFEDEQLLFEYDMYEENVVQTRTKLTKEPLKGSKQWHEHTNIMQRNPFPTISKTTDKAEFQVRVQNPSTMS